MTTAGPECIELAARAGLDLLPWERLVVEQALGQHADESWAAFEVLLIVCRQNGKGSIVEAVQLYMLFVLGLNVFHTAHLMKTSRSAFKRLWALISRSPFLLRRVAGEPQKTAEEIVIRLTSGAFIIFMARGQRAGRGLDDCDVLFLDEALFLEERTTDAIVPTMSTRPNPQVWYTSSAGVLVSALLRKLRGRGMARDPGMAYFEWSIEPPTPGRPVDPTDRALWAQANPSLGALISVSYVANEQRVLGETGFLRERLGVFDEDPDEARRVIPAAAWALRRAGDELRLAVLEEAAPGSVVFAVAAAWPDAAWTSIGVARRVGDVVVVQLVERRRGTVWAVPRARELAERYVAPVVIDPGGPAGHQIAPLEAIEDGQYPVEVVAPTMRQVGHASADFLHGVSDEPFIWHLGQSELDGAVADAGRRTLGDLWTYQRRGEVDISPLEAVTLATWWLVQMPPALEPVSAGGDVELVSSGSDVARMGF